MKTFLTCLLLAGMLACGDRGSNNNGGGTSPDDRSNSPAATPNNEQRPQNTNMNDIPAGNAGIMRDTIPGGTGSHPTNSPGMH